MAFYEKLIPKRFRDRKPKGKPIKDNKIPASVPRDVVVAPQSGGRISEPSYESEVMGVIRKNLQFVKPAFINAAIVYIRKLRIVNEDVGSVINDCIQLTSTQFKIKFDSSVPPDQADKMRRHIRIASKAWNKGSGGMIGLINKLVAQIWISGALSNEWVPRKDLKGLSNCILVNPETITAAYNKRTQDYEFFQEPQGFSSKGNPVKLNPITYKYIGLNNDTENPIGIPPFLTAINALDTQGSMMVNINHIIDQMGIMGFLECLLDKPNKKENETDPDYENRLTQLLIDTKENLKGGMKDGLTVGFINDHEFNFHSPAKNIGGLADVWNVNQVRVANGLKTDPSFLGVTSSTGTEGGLNIVFTKMLSQLKNVQEVLKENLEFGFTLELLLAGYGYQIITIEFHPSTLTDDLKHWQSMEIKHRVAKNMYDDGLYDQDMFADHMGMEKPAQDGPRMEGGSRANISIREDEEKREKDKDTSDRKVRDKNKPQPKPKDAKSKK